MPVRATSPFPLPPPRDTHTTSLCQPASQTNHNPKCDQYSPSSPSPRCSHRSNRSTSTSTAQHPSVSSRSYRRTHSSWDTTRLRNGMITSMDGRSMMGLISLSLSMFVLSLLHFPHSQNLLPPKAAFQKTNPVLQL